MHCRVAKLWTTRAYSKHRVYVAVGGWKIEVRLLPPEQSSYKSIFVDCTVYCEWICQLPTSHLQHQSERRSSLIIQDN